MRLQPVTIEIRGLYGNRLVKAWRLGDWAIHRSVDVPELWVITLLPLGLNLGPQWCSFPRMRQAADAMAEIILLRNDWSVIRQSDLTLKLKEKIKAIAESHGAVEGPVSLRVEADRGRFGQALKKRVNGYSIQGVET